jgi:hypothetical protein
LLLQTLERFLGKRFRLIDFGLFVVRAADADADETSFFKT